MNTIQIASLSFKLAGIFSLIQAIPLLGHVTEVLAFRSSSIFETSTGQAYPGTYMFIGFITSISLLVLLGIILLVFSCNLERKLFAKE